MCASLHGKKSHEPRLPADPPPSFLLSSAWFPVIFAFHIRAAEIFRVVSGLRVTSWWRDPITNLEVGGDPQSQHLFGLGMDIAGSQKALSSAIRVARGVGLVPVDFGNYVHLQLFPAGALERIGVTFPT